MAAFGAIGAGLSLGTSILSAYQANKAQEAEERRQLRLLNEQRSREAFNRNKFLNEYNEEKLRRDLVREGDFSKAGGLFASLQNRLGNQANIAQMRAEDEAVKRGVGNTGFIADTSADISRGVTGALAGGMGQYAGGLQSNLNMIAPAAYDNTAYQNEMALSNMRYAENEPDLGNMFGTVTSYLENLDAEDKFNKRMDRVENVFAAARK